MEPSQQTLIWNLNQHTFPWKFYFQAKPNHSSHLTAVVPRIDIRAVFQQQHNNLQNVNNIRKEKRKLQRQIALSIENNRRRSKYLIVSFRSGEMKRRIETAERRVPGEAGIELEKHSSFDQIAIPRCRDQTLPRRRASERIPHLKNPELPPIT